MSQSHQSWPTKLHQPLSLSLCPWLRQMILTPSCRHPSSWLFSTYLFLSALVLCHLFLHQVPSTRTYSLLVTVVALNILFLRLWAQTSLPILLRFIRVKGGILLLFTGFVLRIAAFIFFCLVFPRTLEVVLMADIYGLYDIGKEPNIMA